MAAAEAAALLAAAKDHPRLGAYVILSLTTGIRTEEARALLWDHVDLDGDPDARTPVPPSIAVWRSVRLHGDTKTEKSRRTLALPQNAVTALREHRKRQVEARLAAGELWQDTGLVFTTRPARLCRCQYRTPRPGTAAHRSPLPRVPHLCLSCTCQPARWYRPGNRGRRKKLTRVLERNNEQPLNDRLRRQANPRPRWPPLGLCLISLGNGAVLEGGADSATT